MPSARNNRRHWNYRRISSGRSEPVPINQNEAGLSRSGRRHSIQTALNVQMLTTRLPVFLFASVFAAFWDDVLVPRAAARDLYVNNLAGDDLLDGGSPTGRGSGRGPVQTLRQALWLANTGDHIALANTGTPYRESVTLFGNKHSGFTDRPFIIDGKARCSTARRPSRPMLGSIFATTYFASVRSGWRISSYSSMADPPSAAIPLRLLAACRRLSRSNGRFSTARFTFASRKGGCPINTIPATPI